MGGSSTFRNTIDHQTFNSLSTGAFTTRVAAQKGSRLFQPAQEKRQSEVRAIAGGNTLDQFSTVTSQ